MRSVNNFVSIRELAPREGFQILQRVIPTAEKVAFIQALAKAHLQEIEVTSFVRAEKVPQLADCDQVVSQIGSPPTGVTYRALCLNGKGYTRSLAFDNLSHPAWFYTGASDTFLAKNANTSFADQLNGFDTEWGSLWRARSLDEVRVMISNAFGCTYEGVISSSTVVARWQKLAEKIRGAGFVPTELSLADTVGFATPNSTTQLIEALRAAGAPEISLHMHDTRGNALECIEAGLNLGVRIIESSVAGLGGCPFTAGAAGNIATERVIALCDKLSLKTGVDSPALSLAANLARGFTT